MTDEPNEPEFWAKLKEPVHAWTPLDSGYYYCPYIPITWIREHYGFPDIDDEA